MVVDNEHIRPIAADPSAVQGLLRELGSPTDRLWPEQWPPIRFDRPLVAGAVGGHGPIRYTVDALDPGRYVRLRFTQPRGFRGWHEFVVSTGSDGRAVLAHRLTMRTRGLARVSWPLVFKPLHDALIEDCLDRAEYETTSASLTTRWSAYVRLLRWLALRIRPAYAREPDPSRIAAERATRGRRS